MRFLSSQHAIAAAGYRFCSYLFRAFPMQMATPAPQAIRGLLAVGPDMAKLLAAAALHRASLSSVSLYLNDNMVMANSISILLEILCSLLR
jgi:hypothetical protein